MNLGDQVEVHDDRYLIIPEDTLKTYISIYKDETPNFQEMIDRGEEAKAMGMQPIYVYDVIDGSINVCVDLHEDGGAIH